MHITAIVIPANPEFDPAIRHRIPDEEQFPMNTIAPQICRPWTVGNGSIYRGSLVVVAGPVPAISEGEERMHDTSKRIRRLVREWAGIAHDRDMRKALGELRIQFGRWERGEIDSFELNEFVHQYHDGLSREIWKRYATNHLEPAVAAAIADGVLRKEELPAELLQHVAGLIEFYEADLTQS